MVCSVVELFKSKVGRLLLCHCAPLNPDGPPNINGLKRPFWASHPDWLAPTCLEDLLNEVRCQIAKRLVSHIRLIKGGKCLIVIDYKPGLPQEASFQNPSEVFFHRLP